MDDESDDRDLPAPDDERVDEVVDRLEEAGQLDRARQLANRAGELFADVDDFDRLVRYMENDEWEAVHDELGMSEGEFHEEIGDLKDEAERLAEDAGFADSDDGEE